jgi:GH25 family lysozyme M1 (1,4-beta-N-acetylmuramidase)
MTYIWGLTDALSQVTQEYGGNRNAIQPGGHTGMDFGVPVGTPVYAEADGVIVFACWADDLGWPNPYYIATTSVLRNPRGGRGGAGIVVGLDTGPFLFIKAHLSRTDMNAGDHVKQGQLIGHSGDTGYTFGAHVHLDILPDGWNVKSADGRYGRVNPRNVIDGNPAAPPAPAPLKPNERRCGGSPVNQRREAKLGSEIVRVIPAGSREVFSHYVRGDNVNWNGDQSDVWLGDDAGYASVLFFDPTTVAGLPDRTPQTPAPAPPPAPVPVPVPVPEPVLHGVDISAYQEGFDVAGSPGDFVIVKASEGVGHTNPGLAARAKAAEGKLRGFYHFARPNATPENTAAAEAAYFLEVVRPYLRKGDVLFLDWESDDTKDANWALKFLRIVGTATRSIPPVYMNVAAVNGADWSQLEAEYPLWLANYPAGLSPAGYAPPATKPAVTWKAGFRMWQYTSTGRLPGWPADLDMNVWYGTSADWTAHGVTVIPETPGVPVPVPPSVFPTLDQPISALVNYYK